MKHQPDQQPVTAQSEPVAGNPERTLYRVTVFEHRPTPTDQVMATVIRRETPTTS